MVGLENLSMDLEFQNFDGIVSPSSFELIVRTHARALESYHFRT